MHPPPHRYAKFIDNQEDNSLSLVKMFWETADIPRSLVTKQSAVCVAKIQKNFVAAVGLKTYGRIIREMNDQIF